MATALIAPRLPEGLSRLDVDAIDDDETFEEVELHGDLTAAHARSVTVERSRLSGVRLTGAELPRLRLIDCVLEGCDLSGALLEQGGWNRVELRDCRLSGTVLTRSALRHVRLTGCRADAVVLRFATAEHLLVEDCAMNGADLASATCTATRIVGTDLTSADLSQARFDGADVRGSVLDGIVGATALRGAVISSAQVVPVALAVFTNLGIRVDDD